MNHYELTDKNHPAPPRAKWMDVALQQIKSDFGIDLRMVWGPDVDAFRWGGMVKLYAAYATVRNRGWFRGMYVPDGNGGQVLRRTGYHPPGDYLNYTAEGAHRLADGSWLIPDPEFRHVAWPRWIIERRAPDRERVSHEANRYEWDPDTGERIDALGPWPEGGRWFNFYVVAQHMIRCCGQANAEHRLCYGIGRDPNEHDLDHLRQTVQTEVVAPARPEPGSQEWNRQYTQNVKAAMAEHKEAEQRQREGYRARMRNVVAPTLGKAANLDTTLPETISTAPPVILDRFQRAARAHLIDLEQKGDTYNGRSA
jgi:hypothetical protein